MQYLQVLISRDNTVTIQYLPIIHSSNNAATFQYF